ncbi:MAG TPA: thioesterase family protein [Candidimonas sp.]|nr:thioesterase family protein [Candidimonas sp.]
MQFDTTSAAPAIGGTVRYTMPVRWGDMDAQRHVNNTVYFRFFEEARVRLFEDAGIALSANRVGILAHTSCDFLKPIIYPASVVITQVLVRVGRSSMSIDATIEREDEPGVPYATGNYVMVCANAETGKSVPWTSVELEGFAKLFRA